MEKYKKRDMLQTVDMLLKANDAIVRTARFNPQGTSEALAQCQESAIALGTYIDTLGDRHASLVHILEDYCENIYQMSERLSDENACRKISKKIQKQLAGLRNSIKYDLPEDKKEIVFLPYKASMWDSLESVWKAADADPDCDAYVIPIPYFDKNPDGSFREEHYEGDQYPKNVPITRYDEYDLEAHHPDIIYIHNPYDECNHVTSVHPYFYSKNLRNYTDKLVYIPYFVLGEINPDDQAAIDGMKHFCFTPGTIYANQVIVQSESMRQIYINEYMKAAREMGLSGEHVDRKFLEKKFLGTGSPKIDKVLNTKKEDLEIPEEWLKVIEKPDGSWKKIVFYNTSVSALLQHGEKMLRKMESVFGIFKENRDEVALLWRPHPLIQATIESMRPELWEGYKEIRDRYIEEGWGIYDNSAELDRAVVLSDAYYGDGSSSVVQLCKKVGMPVMVQDVEKLNQDSDVLRFNNMYINEKWGYFVSTYFWQERLFRINLENGEICDLGELPVNSNENCAFSLLCGNENTIVIMPYLSQNQVVQYDIEKSAFGTIEKIKGEYRGFPKCTNSVKYKDSIFLIVNEENYIIEYQCVDRKFVMHELCMRDKIEYNEWAFYWNGYSQVENIIYLPLKNSGKIAELNLNNFSARIVKEFKGYKIQKISYFEGSMWLIPFKGNRIIKWNIVSDKNDVIEMPIDQNKEYPFCGIYKLCNFMALIPNCINDFFEVSEKNFTVKKIDSTRYGIREEIIGENFEVTVVGENVEYIFLIVNKMAELIRISKQSGMIYKYDLQINKTKSRKTYKNRFVRNGFAESGGLSLRQYLDTVVQSEW